MNVGQLKRAIANLPDDMPVVTEDSEAPWSDDIDAYIAPANRRPRYLSIGPGHINPQTDWAREVYGDYENIHVLLLASGGADDDWQKLTLYRPDVIDGEIAHKELTQ